MLTVVTICPQCRRQISIKSSEGWVLTAATSSDQTVTAYNGLCESCRVNELLEEEVALRNRFQKTPTGGAPREDTNTVSAINTLGNLTVRINSQRVFSASQYNTNRYFVLEIANGVELPTEVTKNELTSLERGHYYTARRITETSWKLYCPYRYADEETAEFGKGVKPSPTDEELLEKWKDTACRWQMVDKEFVLTDMGYKFFKKKVEEAGGCVVEESASNKNLEEQYNRVQETLKVAHETQERVLTLMAEIRAGSGMEAVDRVRKIASTRDALKDLYRRAKDGFIREKSLLNEEWGRLEDKNLTRERWAAIDELGLELGEILADLATAPAEAQLAFVHATHNKHERKEGSVETLSEAIRQLSIIFPHFAHITVDTPSNSLVIEYAPERFMRITTTGAELWQPVQKQVKGRFGALDIKVSAESRGSR